MEQLLLKSLHNRRINIGEVSWDRDISQVRISLDREYADQYKSLIVRIIQDIENKGKFGTSFDKEAMTVGGASETYWKALAQTLFMHLPIVIEEGS